MVARESFQGDAAESKHSRLLQLPTEIREAIFCCYFSSLEFQLLSKRNTNPSKKSIPLQCRSNAQSGDPLALLAVSRQIREEALPHLEQAQIIITALFPGWHQASRDTLGLSAIHAHRICRIELRFLDSNFSLLQAVPKLKEVYVSPPGELRCQRRDDNPANANSCWSQEEIDGERGRSEMRNELATSMKLMHDLVDASHMASPMEFDVHFSVGFKFLIKPLHWSLSGRLLSTRGNFYSVHCTAIGHFDSRLGVTGDDIQIHSVKPLQA